MKNKYPSYFFKLILSIGMTMSIGCHVEAKEKIESTSQTKVETVSINESSEKNSINKTESSMRSSLKGVSDKPEKKWGDLQNLREFSLNDDGVGIVAYNFGKSMEDFQELNGDESAAREMILYETGAVAYGLSGSKVVDVSEHIEVGDLGDLFSVSSNDLAEHHIKLTVPSEYSGTGKELSTEIIIYTGKVAKVSTWDELDKALMSNDTTIVDIQRNLTNTRTNRLDRSLNNSRKDYVLLGNGYSLDFIGHSYKWGNSTSIMHKPVVDNVDLYGGHYFGPVTMWDHNAYGSSIKYRNMNYTGSQVTASFQAQIIFEGKNNVRSKDTAYTSYDGIVRTMINQKESGLESHTLTFSDNTETLIETEQGDAVILGSWYSNHDVVGTIQPSLTTGQNSKVTLRTLGNSGETNAWQITPRDRIESVISIQRNGRIDVGEKSKLVIETAEGTTRVPVRMGYMSPTDNNGNPVKVTWTTSSINLKKNSVLEVNSNGPIATDTGRASVMMAKNAQINIGDGAKMNVNSKNMTKGAPIFKLGDNSQVNIAKSGDLTINKDGGNGKILDLGANSKFNVSDEGTATFISKNEADSKDSMIYGGSNSSFIIGERGNFTSRIEDGTGVRSMLEFDANANFTFANARKVDLDSRSNTNAILINMNQGTFNASIQQVRAWTKENPDSEEPAHNWRPMYGMKIPYDKQNVITNKVVASSIRYDIRDDFKANYKTQDFSRVVYDYIPDVKLGVEDNISDNPKITSGQVIKGTVNAGASVAFYKVVDENDPSKDTYLTTPSFNSPEEGNNVNKFHLELDKNTNEFEFKIPSSVELKAGEKIRVYAFLDGKDDSVIKEVQDKTPPTGEGIHYYESLNSTTPLPEKFVANIKDTNPNNKGFTYQFNKETPQDTVDGYMSQIGEHVVKIDVSDEAGNTVTIDSKLTIIPNKTNLTSKDLSISYKELRNMSEDEIKQYIIENGNLEAYKLVEGKKVDLTKFILVKDLNGLSDLANIKATPYSVSLVVSAKDAEMPEDILGEIKVSVTDIDSVVTLHFVNEVAQVMDDYTATIKAKVGDVLDLTKHDTVMKQFAQLNSDGYLIDQTKRPEKENDFAITDTEVTVTYKVHGTLQFKSVPTELDFGSVKYIARPNRVEKPTYDKELVVRDTRSGQADGFRVTASVTTPLQTKDGKKLQDVLRYVSSGKEVILSEAEEPIYRVDKAKNALHDISKDWGDKKDSDGIKLQLSSSGDIHTGQYTGEITWKIMEGQP